MTTTDRVVKFTNLGLAFFGLIGVGLLLKNNDELRQNDAALKNEITTLKDDQKNTIQPALSDLLDYTKTSAALWDALQQYNKNISVPQVIEVPPTPPAMIEGHPPSKIFIVKSSPTPTPAKPVVTKRSARRKSSPTPKPIFNWFKHK